jgi:serine/threonine-protein kinase
MTPGRRFGRYELLLELAAGGMATLHLARLCGPEQFEKLVAIKIIHPHLTRDPKFVAMFLDEARISALLHDANVVQIFDLGEIDGTYFIAMEYIRGQDFRSMLRAVARRRREAGAFSPRPDWVYSVRVAADAAAGLHVAHELRSPLGEPMELVHRDVSPHNLLVGYDGQVKLTDFGIAYAKRRLSHTDSGTVKGKMAYMSPEHAAGTALDRRADVFSLGVVLWEAVTLRRLFKRDTDTATLVEVTKAEVPSPHTVRPDLPPALDAVILRALERRPADRFPTARALQMDLQRVLQAHAPGLDREDLGRLMRDLFATEERQTEERIRAAMLAAPLDEASAPEPTPRPTGETRLSAEVRPAPAMAGGARSWAALVIGAVALVAVLVVGYVVLGRRDAPAPAAPPPARGADAALASAPAPDAAAPARLLVTFTVKPDVAEATLVFRGKRYRQNRLELLLSPASESEVVRVEAPGFEPVEQHVTVSPGAQLAHELTLKPAGMAPAMGPSSPLPRTMGVGPADIGLDD